MTFRHRITLLVGLAAIALITVTAVTLVMGRRSERQVAEVELRYVPLLELNRDVEALFTAMQRALENAASAAESSALHEADRLRDELFDRIRAGRTTITSNGGDATALLSELKDYYALAREVSAALLAGDTGDGLTEKIQRMQAAQGRCEALLQSNTTPDRRRVSAAFETARRTQRTAIIIDVVVAAAALAIMLLLSWGIVRRAMQALRNLSAGIERLARGDFSQEIQVVTRDEFGDVANQGNLTAQRLREYRRDIEREDWVKTGLNGLAAETAGQHDPRALGGKALAYLAAYVDAPVAVIYVCDEAGAFRLLASRGTDPDQPPPPEFRLGETLPGQAARDDQVAVLDALPDGYLRIRSGLGAMAPRHVVIVPFAHEGRPMGVLELGYATAPTSGHLNLLRRCRGRLGLAFRVAAGQQRTQALLEETQRQAEELRTQQEALRQTNDELEEQTSALEAQRSAVLSKNEELLEAHRLLEEKAAEVARASRYKTEFLANMSHELRTPLNSIMILSQLLADNEDRNLDDKQVEFSTIIHKSGEELLTLINDVLDMAKIEAGKQDLLVEAMSIAEIAAYVRRMFNVMATEKGLAFEVEVAPGVPPELRTDRTRLTQILKNLVSNAIKFTAAGRVAVQVVPRGAGAIAFRVSDTGIGIAPEKQQLIFEAFAQADGGTSRQYGGTGLGLSIARQLARLLGGDLAVESQVGVGSTFDLTLPVAGPGTAAAPPEAIASPAHPPVAVADDRGALVPGQPCLLVIEDDPTFAAVVLRLTHDAGLRCLVAATGQEGIALAERHRPTGIVLDVGLPDIDGWSVMERLQRIPATRGIPVHVITAADGAARASNLGAVGFLAKPAGADQIRNALSRLEAGRTGLRTVLLVEADPAARTSLADLLAASGIAVDPVATGHDALQRLRRGGVGGVVQNLALPDKESGFDLLARIREIAAAATLPVVVHTGLALTAEEIRRLEVHDQATLIVQGERSPERVIDEVRLFLERVRSVVGAPEAHPPAPNLDGKSVLIVDDDMRNVYSLSTALRARHLRVLTAADGQEALDELAAHPDVDAVLMDVMMPRMDGHEATHRIRQQPQFRQLPIIALTAKTMPGERQRCIEAGANDYVPKPVDVDRLVQLLGVWLR